MTTTASGIWTPDDANPYNLTVDLAAMAVSIENIVKRFRPTTSGSATVATLTASTTATLTVNFPAGTFTRPPRVVLTSAAPPAWSPAPTMRVTSRTPTSFTVEMYSSVGRSNVSFDWIAVQE